MRGEQAAAGRVRRASWTCSLLVAAGLFTPLGSGCRCDPSSRPSEAAARSPAPIEPGGEPKIEPSRLAADETVVFIPTYAVQHGGLWRLPIEAWVFEFEDDGLVRSKLVEEVTEFLGSGEALDTDRIARIAHFFLVDNERGKRIVMGLESDRAYIGTSGPNGRASGSMQLELGVVSPVVGGGPVWVTPRLVLPPGDERDFQAAVGLLPDEGVSVISDIDDTIKLTGVTDKRAMIESTFAKPFEATPGVPEAYRRWAKAGAAFHYISNSPLPLLAPLLEFIEDSALPLGSVGLKGFRWRDGTFLDLFDAPEQHKQETIETTLRAFERRSFVLVGDSGERDPEIYAAVARTFPDRVTHVYIRDVGSEDATALRERMERTFASLETPWTIFRHGNELPPTP